MNNNPFVIYEKKAKKQSATNKKTLEIDTFDSFSSNDNKDNLKKPSSLIPIKYLFVLIAFLFSSIIIRVFFLQFIKGSEYRELAEDNRIQLQITKALRGVIYDTNNEPLVKNVPNFSLNLEGKKVLQIKRADYKNNIEKISNITNLTSSEIEKLISKSLATGQVASIKENIPYEEALQLIVRCDSVTGLFIETYNKREYIDSVLFSHIIGYTGKLTEEEYSELKDKKYQLNDENGKIGLEKYYENELRGTNGYRQIEVDIKGVEKSIISDSKPVPGFSIYLSINSRYQQILFNKLKEVVQEKDLPGASAIALDPNNGQILALVSYPAYDNNLFVGGISTDDYNELINNSKKPLFHRSISGEYPSGSTFKPIVAAAALEEKIITKNSSILSTGGLQIDKYYFPDWKAGGHGQTNVIKALAESVNTFFYIIGGGDNEATIGLGVDKITTYAKKFGLSSTVGIDLPGERSGFLPSKAWKEEFKNERWYIGDTYHLAIGQGDILATPLQVANYTAIIANGGAFYQPQLLSQITDINNNIIREQKPLIKNEQVISNESINIVKQGLREAVLTGSARSLQALPVSSAGKTGTAQFGAEDKTHSWFTAFAPYENPEIVITVLVEEGGGGNDTALPIAREFLQEIY